MYEVPIIPGKHYYYLRITDKGCSIEKVYVLNPGIFQDDYVKVLSESTHLAFFIECSRLLSMKAPLERYISINHLHLVLEDNFLNRPLPESVYASDIYNRGN